MSVGWFYKSDTLALFWIADWAMGLKLKPAHFRVSSQAMAFEGSNGIEPFRWVWLHGSRISIASPSVVIEIADQLIRVLKLKPD